MTTADTGSMLRLDDVGTWGPRYWIGLVCSIGIATVHLYVWSITGMPQFLAIGGSFAFGVCLFFTRFWEPVLYLVGIVHLIALAVVWVLGGTEYRLLGIANGVFSLVLFGIAVSLFVSEHRELTD